MNIIPLLVKEIAQGLVLTKAKEVISDMSNPKRAFSKENLNPVKTPSTSVSYGSAGAFAYLLSNPPGTEYDVYMQVAAAIVSVITFFLSKKTPVAEQKEPVDNG